MRAIDLTGQKFGRLTVTSFAGSRILSDNKSYRYWHCICECGVTTEVAIGNLRGSSHSVLSCGCLQKERAAEINGRHFKTGTPEYQAWAHMRQRCTNPNSKDFKNYGGRGIGICARWESFESFLSDMGSRPTPQHTVDRINNENNYGPDNCRWATRAEQNSNTRQNRWLTFKGRTMTTSQWARFMGVPDTILHKRVCRGWSVERVLTTPVRGHNANLL